MDRLVPLALQAHDTGATVNTLVLIVSAFLIFSALRMVGHALVPLGAILRSLAAAGAVVLLLLVALALILLSLVTWP
ncbi:hypothetical protein [Actinoplanes sp. NPDC051851]|uniref:hypothetical protein n=1 Tax=Actinoplanes sp. NPDC051851 TaxID=3154753 RepID=UPI0034305F56